MNEKEDIQLRKPAAHGNIFKIVKRNDGLHYIEQSTSASLYGVIKWCPDGALRASKWLERASLYCTVKNKERTKL